MTTIYLIRHGETEWNLTNRVMGRTDVPLNETGQAQAEGLAEVLERFSLDEIYSSPQLRARQTAAPIAARHGKSVQVEPALAEVDFPRWVGMTWQEIQGDEIYQMYHRAPAEARHESFEPVAEVKERICAFLEKVAAEQPKDAIAMVSHADPLRTIVSDVLKQPLNEFRRFRFSNASLTIIEGKPGSWMMKLFNYRSGDEIYSDRW